MIGKFVTFFLIFFMTSACVVKSYKSVGYDQKGENYSTSRMKFTLDGTGGTGSCYVLVHIRNYENNGKIHSCGYLQEPDQNSCSGISIIAEDLAHQWFSSAVYILAGQEISSASFLDFRSPKIGVPCIATDIEWRPEFKNSTARFKGGYVSQQY